MRKIITYLIILFSLLSISALSLIDMGFASYTVVPPELTTTEIVTQENNPLKFLSSVIAYAIGMA
jgi:predicted aspartyl protease